MKFLSFTAALLLTTVVFAHNHEETLKTVGHDKEHQHVPKDKMDHEHDDYHHEKHDHKAHHPDHDQAVKKKK